MLLQIIFWLISSHLLESSEGEAVFISSACVVFFHKAVYLGYIVQNMKCIEITAHDSADTHSHNYQNNNTSLCFVDVVTKSKPGENTIRPNINQEISVKSQLVLWLGRSGLLHSESQTWPTVWWSYTIGWLRIRVSLSAVAISEWRFWESTNLDSAFKWLNDTDCGFCNERRYFYRQEVFCTWRIRPGRLLVFSRLQHLTLEQERSERLNFKECQLRAEKAPDVISSEKQ